MSPPTDQSIQKGYDFKKEQGKVYGGDRMREGKNDIIIPYLKNLFSKSDGRGRHGSVGKSPQHQSGESSLHIVLWSLHTLGTTMPTHTHIHVVLTNLACKVDCYFAESDFKSYELCEVVFKYTGSYCLHKGLTWLLFYLYPLFLLLFFLTWCSS